MKPGLASKNRTGPAALLALAFLFVCRAAQACPSCTTRSGGGLLVPILLGAMILTPYIVATVVLRIVRRAEAERAREDAALEVPTSGLVTGGHSHSEAAPAGGAPARA